MRFWRRTGSAAISPSTSASVVGADLLDRALSAVGGLAVQPRHCPARDRPRLAPSRIPTLLALEVTSPISGSPADRRRDPHADPPHGRRESHLRSPQDPERAPVTRL